MTEPFNLALHEHLLSLGYTYERCEATWEDVGDAENGPQLVGGPAFDEYTSPTDYVIFSEYGESHTELRDLDFEKFIAQMQQGFEA